MNIKEEYHNWMRSDKFIPTGLGAWNACAELMQKRIDELELQLSIEKGTKAWADVKNSSQWVDELRGGSDE